MTRGPSRVAPAAALLGVLALALAPGGAVERVPSGAGMTRATSPEDRYALAGGCYAVRALDGGRFVARRDGGFGLGSTDPAGAEPFFFQATDLGRYLLYASKTDFLAASDGTAGEIVYPISRSTPGGVASGLSKGATDAAVDAVATGPLGAATGRGSSVLAASQPGELADWEIDRAAGDGFSIQLPATGQALAVRGDDLVLAGPSDPAGGALFGFEPAAGCAVFPEIEVNVEGPVARGDTPFGEVSGFLDQHGHMMAFEFLGGRVRCGDPWDRYGVAAALVDCPDHVAGGRGAVLESVLSGTDPSEGHSPDGWPTFAGWPRWEYLTHEQVYYKWLERAWRGGLRLYVNLFVDNAALCNAYPFKKNSCNEMDGVRLQAERIRELERYIDAQSGGPGEGWFRIVSDPFEARRAINAGKLAIVQGIEVSTPFDCGLVLDTPTCDASQIDSELDAAYRDLGVRQMEITNKFDNALTGVTGDAGTTGIVVNNGNFTTTGRWWQMETCGPQDGGATDEPQLNLSDEAGPAEPVAGRDSLVAAVLQLSGRSGAAPLYPPAPHCNVRGLSALGSYLIRRIMAKGMIFDPDHMSARARTTALDLLTAAGYSGVVSSHGWADDTIYPRIMRLGGVVTPSDGSPESFVEKWKKQRRWADPRFIFGFGYGADTNGFSRQPGPRPADAPNKVSYPFTGFGGVTIDRQRSGTRVYDVNVDGVAHYGLYPDWIEQLRLLAGNEIVNDMTGGAEAYLQMWERAVGIAPDACRPDVPDLTDAAFSRIAAGMNPEAVLRLLGQPRSREGTTFTYCLTDERTGTVTFSAGGSLADAEIR